MASPLKRKAVYSSRTPSPPPRRRRGNPEEAVGSDQNSIEQASKNKSESASTTTTEHVLLYSWNVNGIDALLQKKLSFPSTSMYPLRKFLKDHNWPHVLCLQEVKINRHDQATQRRVELAANAGSQQGEPSYTTYFSLPRDKHNATGFGGKVYGVATLIREDLCPEGIATLKPDWDLEGRVLIHELRDPKVVIVNAYWVNGTSNPYRDPETGVESGTRHDHKLRFHEHILTLCKALVSENKHVILLGDVNVARSKIDGHPNLRESPIQHVKNRADFNEKFFDGMDGMKAVDVFRHLHAGEKKYTYHGRGVPWGERCDRVDMIIVSSSIAEAQAINATDICDNPKDRGHSDHVPLWIKIDNARLRT